VELEDFGRALCAKHRLSGKGHAKFMRKSTWDFVRSFTMLLQDLRRTDDPIWCEHLVDISAIYEDYCELQE
jgi:hypothetical protein